MWLWGMLALLSVTAFGQVDHSPQWGLSAGSYDTYWGIKNGFPSYKIYDKENLNFGDYENIKGGQELIQASNYDELLNYTYFGQYIIHGYLNNIYAKKLFGNPETYTSDISRYFRYPSSTQAEGAVSNFFESKTGMFTMLGSKQYTLFKYHKYQYPLKDLGISGTVAIANTSIKGLIVLIHGHNNSLAVNPYLNDKHWLSLRSSLDGKVSQNTEWKVIGYDWAEDAANGELGLTGAGARKSAVAAHFHGIHLADSIKAQFPNLQKVHFITHSAGLWVARSACVGLGGTFKTQITALDPFLPTMIDPGSVLNSAKVSELSALPNMYRTENYFVKDITESDILYQATSQTYTWPTSNQVQMQLDNELYTSLYPTAYNASGYSYHSGPIQWYSDSISSLGSPTYTLNFYPFRANQGEYGWSKSIFMNEPHIRTCPTELVVAPDSTTVISTSSKSYNNELNLNDTNDPIQSSWQFKDTSSGQWNAQSATSSAVQFHASAVKGSYALRYIAYNSAGYDMRDITIRVRSYYEQWAEVSNGLTGSSADALADISGNGVPNIIKFALGKTPGDKSAFQYSTSTLTSNSKKYLKISLPRTGKPSGVLIAPEVSSDLQTWNSTEAQTITDTASEYSAQDLVPMDSATKRFIRLRFTEQ